MENDNPAFISYYDSGKPNIIGSLKCKSQFTNDKYHRENDLPAHIEYYESGAIKMEEWLRNGKRFRSNRKPAFIWYNDIEYTDDPINTGF